jgi:periplasmic protein CpxP/Spy
MTRPSRQKWLLVLVGILLATNIITLAVFWSTKKSKDNKSQQRPRMGQFIVDQMKFDSVQEAAYWSLRDSMVEKQRPVWDSIRVAKKRFFDLTNQPGAADSLLQARANEVMAFQKRLDSITLRHFQQVRTLVHPDQVQKFDTVIQEIVNRMTPQRRQNNNNKPGENKDSALKK